MSVQEYSPDGTAGAATPADIVAAVERASTRRTTPNGAGEVVWHIWGKGDPVVLVHGGTGSWRHWIRNIEYLARFSRNVMWRLVAFEQHHTLLA